MLHIDYFKQEEPFEFIRELMKGSSEMEIVEAHERFCEYLNQLVRIYNRGLESDDIESDSVI